VANLTGIELLQPGEPILNGQYTIEKHLGSGGQGQVYLARHRIFDQVAIKRLHWHVAVQPEGLARFERELRITHQLRGEHVILIHNFDRDLARGEWFSVMEYANGGSLEDKLATESPLPVAEGIQLTIALCQVLTPIHEYPYVHGDLKPSNILFHTKLDQESILKLSDFGSAFQPIRAGVLPLPSGLKAARTILYVSPELLDASDPEDMEALTVDVDQRADIYAIGVILHEMLTGRPPFWQPSGESEDVMILLEQRYALFQKVKYQVPPEPKTQRREILPALNDLVMKALAKDPADRFASVDEMRASLEKTLQEEERRLAELTRLRPLADQAFKEERWGQASDLFYKIIDLAPDDPDALQKLKMAQDQQQLMSLRHQVPRKMNEGFWQEVKVLIEEALKIAPDDATLTAWQAKTDDQLTIIGILEQAKKAENRADWREVINFCLEALRLDPSHIEASTLLSRAQTRYRIATLCQEAEALCRQDDKQGELEKLKELQKLVPADENVSDRIEALEKAIELETYYAQGKRAYDERRWQEAVEAMEKVLTIDSFYRQDEHSAAHLKADAEKKLMYGEAETFRTLPQTQERIQQQVGKYLLPRLKGFHTSIDIKAKLKEIWLLMTHNQTVTIASLFIATVACIAAVLAIPGALQLFETPTIEKVKIFLDGNQIAEPSIESDQPISLNELPTLTGGRSVNLKVIAIDRNSTIYSGNDLKCRWSVAPIDDESQVINTEACVAHYTPSRNYSRQTVAVEVQAAEQQFKPIPLISMEFEITNK
jgi:serine/threonine protein kinase